jgi:hypothetical protein
VQARRKIQMQLQTWGTAFSSAGRTAAALRAKQEAPAMEYKKQAGSSGD